MCDGVVLAASDRTSCANVIFRVNREWLYEYAVPRPSTLPRHLRGTLPGAPQT